LLKRRLAQDEEFRANYAQASEGQMEFSDRYRTHAKGRKWVFSREIRARARER
jgi:hypothetical protein